LALSTLTPEYLVILIARTPSDPVGGFSESSPPRPNRPPERDVTMSVKALDTADNLTRETDEELMSRYRDRGQPADFDELLHRYQREIYRYLTRYLGNATLADDVFQNTFLQVHLKRGLYEDGRPVRPWLYAIATHQAVDALRKAGRHPTISLDQHGDTSETDTTALVNLLVSDLPGPAAQLQGEERRDWIRASIAKLPDALRQTLLLAYYEDLKYREIAEILKIPVGTVKSRLHAALAKIAEMAGARAHVEDE
jgi:RNA polymerase sigma-70 factor (ECF subfamily)